MADKIKNDILQEYKNIYNNVQNNAYNQNSMNEATDKIEELDLDEVAFEGLVGRISSNASDAKAGDFINKDKLHDINVWTDGTLDFIARDDGTYKIVKTTNTGEKIVMGFTDKKGMEDYLNLNGNVTKDIQKDSQKEVKNSEESIIGDMLEYEEITKEAQEKFLKLIRDYQYSSLSDMKKGEKEFKEFCDAYGDLPNFQNIINSTGKLYIPDWMRLLIIDASK